MGRHVAGENPAVDRLVDEACAEIGREIDALCVPGLAGVVLGGGYGRGEGGVKEKLEGIVRVGEGNDSALQLKSPTPTLSNDLDFFAIAEEGAPEAQALATIGAVLKPVSEKWTAKLGVDVDFTVKTPWRLKHDEERIMVQELVRGFFDVAGKRGEEMFAGIVKIDAAKLPWMEAARLLMNRGMGLLFSFEPHRTRDFVARNINKCILGVGDAFLVSRGLYRWRAEERAAALAEQGDSGLYARAVEWKFRPREEPVCDWETARETWEAGRKEVVFAVDDDGCRRTLRNAARWLVRRRRVGELRTFALDPVVRVLETVTRCVRERRAPDAALLRDWEIFN